MSGQAKLWAVLINGPDDVIAAPSEKAAADCAAYYRSRVRCSNFTVIEWPHSAEAHAVNLLNWQMHYPPARNGETA